MATYNYKCLNCETAFDIKATLQEKEEGGRKFVCPKCGAKEIKPIFSAVNFLKNIFVSDINGGCCSGGDCCGIDCKPTENNTSDCDDKKDGSGCCG